MRLIRNNDKKMFRYEEGSDDFKICEYFYQNVTDLDELKEIPIDQQIKSILEKI